MNRKMKKGKITFVIYVLCFMQIIFVFILAAYRVFRHIFEEIYTFDLEDLTVLAVFTIMVFLFYSLFRVALQIKLAEEQSQLQQDIISNMQELNEKIRSQRHDFLNHMQVVYSLLELKDYQEAEAYLKTLYGEIERVNTFLKTEDAALNSLLQAKSNDADRRGIQFKTNIHTRLKGCGIQSIDLCRIMGNLLDNALYATALYEGEKKEICVTIVERIDEYEMSVSNTGNDIAPDILPKLFTHRYTSKGAAGEGMGLLIVKKAADQYGGSAFVTSKDQLTIFSCTLKKRAADTQLEGSS